MHDDSSQNGRHGFALRRILGSIDLQTEHIQQSIQIVRSVKFDLDPSAFPGVLKGYSRRKVFLQPVLHMLQGRI